MNLQTNIETTLSRAKSLFFVGIGGISMSSLAMLTARRGIRVGGYDRTRSEVTGRLEAAGGPQVPKAREGSRALGAPRYAHRSVLGLKERAQPAQGSISVRVSKAG